MGYLSRRKADLALALVLSAAIFAAAWYRHATFRSTTYDLAVVEQVLWKMGRGLGATSSLTSWNTFADHFAPIMVVFVPLYRLAASPLWLFGAQAAAIGVGLLCVRPLARTVGLDEDGWATRALLAAYVISPALWNAALFDFHTTTLAVPVLIIGVIASLRNDHRRLWLCLGGLILLRDDLALAGAVLALMGWRADRAGRRSRALIITTALIWSAVGTRLGAAMGSTRHWEFRYGYLGDSAFDAAVHLPRTLVTLAGHLFVQENLLPVLALLLPLALLPLGRPGWVLLVGVLALPVLAANDPNFRSPAYHYGAPLFPLLLAAAAATLASPRFGFSRPAVVRHMPSRVEKLAAAAVVAMAANAFVVVGPPGTRFLSVPAVSRADARRAIATIGRDDAVVATTYLGAHLAHRKTLLPFPSAIIDIKWESPLDKRVTDASTRAQRMVDVVIIAYPTVRFEVRAVAAAVAQLRVQGFRSQRFGQVTVYRRPAGGTTLP